MEALVGITGSDFVLLAADRVSSRSIVVMKGTESKFRDLNSSVSMCYSGESGDTVQFAEYIQRNVQLYSIKNEIDLNPSSTAHFTRRQLADSLRSRKPYQVFMLIGGVDKLKGPELYWIDYLGALAKVPFAAHGYASYFLLSLLDRHYKPNITVNEALELFKMCLAELKTRFIANLPEFTVKIIREGSIEEMVL